MFQGDGLEQEHTHYVSEAHVSGLMFPKKMECPFLHHISKDPILLTAYNLVIEKFEGKIRRTGEPAHTHSIAVAEIIFYATEEISNSEERNVMLLLGKIHDLLEDTKTSHKAISTYFGASILESLKLLTREKKSADPMLNKENYWRFIEGLDGAPFFVQIVKMADRLHNLKTLLDTKDNEFILRQIEETNIVYLPKFLTWVTKMPSDYQSSGWKLLNEINDEVKLIELTFHRNNCPTSSEDQALG